MNESIITTHVSTRYGIAAFAAAAAAAAAAGINMELFIIGTIKT